MLSIFLFLFFFSLTSRFFFFSVFFVYFNFALYVKKNKRDAVGKWLEMLGYNGRLTKHGSFTQFTELRKILISTKMSVVLLTKHGTLIYLEKPRNGHGSRPIPDTRKS